MLPLLYPEQPTATTFAEPGGTSSFGEQLTAVTKYLPLVNPHVLATRIGTELLTNPKGTFDIFRTAERQTRLVETAFSRDASMEEAYDRRIKAVLDATGEKLENPERGGYGLTERDLRRLNQDNTGDEPIDPAAYRRLMFEGKLREAREKNPDKVNDLTFGSIDDEAQAIAKGAEEDYTRARAETKLSTPTSLAASFAGSAWGMRRDPLFVGSLFAGPTGAVGRTVAARVVSSGVIQGLFNAGLSALEQPAVQAWRAEIGVKSGVVPAIENVGMAFLFGFIPGAVLRGAHELAAPTRQAIERVLAGNPAEGDIAKAIEAVGRDTVTPEQRQAVHIGEQIDEVDKALQPPPVKDMAPQMRDDLMTAAQRIGDDPLNQPAPAAVEALARAEPDVPRFVENPVLREEDAPPVEQCKNPGFCYPTAARVAMRNDINYVIGSTKAGTPERIYHAWAETRDGRFVYDGTYERWFDAKLYYDAVDAQVHYRDQLTGTERIDINNGTIPGPKYMEMPASPADAPQLTPLSGARKARTPLDPEVSDRIAAAQPQSAREAQMAATQALEDIGNRDNGARLRAQLDEPTYSLEETFDLPPAGLKTVVEDRGGGGFFVRSTGDRGDMVTMFVEPDSVHVSVATVGRATRGQGVGVALYERAVEFAKERGLPLRSDMSVSADAVHVYEALRRRGYKVTEAPGTTSSESGKTNATAGYVFEVGPKRTATEIERSKDPLDKIPMVRESGEPTMVSPKQAALAGERETQFADLIRACK